MTTPLNALDSISHLSFDKSTQILQGSGLSRGSDIITEEGDKIKAGKFPVLFYANTTLQENNLNRLKKFQISKRNKKLLTKVNNNGRDTLKTVSGIRSVPTLGNLNSE